MRLLISVKFEPGVDAALPTARRANVAMPTRRQQGQGRKAVMRPITKRRRSYSMGIRFIRYGLAAKHNIEIKQNIVIVS